MNEEKMTLNEALRWERERRGWSRKYVAEVIGAADSNMIGRWERGIYSPSPHFLQKLCALYGRTAEELGVFQHRASERAEKASAQAPFELHLVPAGTHAALANQTVSPLPLWTVPYLRNRYFTGREELLSRLRETLSTQQSVCLTSLSGLGGIGKTQAALEYAYRYTDEYDAIVWIHADSRQALLSWYARLAELLNLPEKAEADQQRVAAAVVRWLQQTRQHWLLILDNFENMELLSEFLPTRGAGHILLTTRTQATGPTIQSIELETLEREEGTLLLLRRANLLKLEGTLEQASEQECREAETISGLLGGLPLALEQVGAYIEENQCSIADYLRLYQTRRAELLRRGGGSGKKSAAPVVATTWNLSFERVERVNPAAADLLRLCAFLQPDSIAEAMLLAGGAELGPTLQTVAEDSIRWDEAIGVLRRSSLMRRAAQTKTLTLHRLVQVVLKDAMDAQTYSIWAERVVRVVNSAFPEVEFASWPNCQAYLPHALLCAELIEQEGMGFPDAARLLHQAACYLHRRARYGEAEPLFQQALTIREQALGPTHPDTANTLDKLGWLYCVQGKYAQAEPLSRRALTIREQILGPAHPDTAQSLNHLGWLYRIQSKYEQAEPLYQRALTIREQAFAPTHPDTAQSLSNLAILYLDQGKYEQAEPLYQRALFIYEQAMGPTHPDTATGLNNLAVLYDEQGKYEQAEALYQRSITIREQVLGPDHPDMAQSFNNLAELYRVQGKYEQAEPLYQRALSIWEQGLGPTHHITAMAIGNLAELYRVQGKYELAEPLIQRALSLLEQQLGPEHVEIVRNLHNLAVLYRVQGKYELAEPLAQRTLSIRERQLGPEHVETAISLNELGLLYRDQGKKDLVEPLLQRALSIREHVLGSSHPETARSLHALAVLYRDQGKDEQAEALFLRALSILEKALGSEHPTVADMLEDYAVLVQRTKAKTNAAEVERQLKAISDYG